MKKKPAASVTRRRTAVLVLGMHRSGTSALARVVNLLGAAAPNTLMPADATNPRGFWESNKLVPINEALLKAMSSSWDDWQTLDPAGPRDAAAFAAQLKDGIAAEFGDAKTFVVKDPRICRVLPFWLETLKAMEIDAVAYHIIRNPLEVASSLKARDEFAFEKSMLLWLRHVLDAERDSRSVPRAFLSYESLLTDWREALTSAGKQTGLPWPSPSAPVSGEITEFLSDELRRNRASAADLDAHPNALAWVKEVYSAAQALTADPSNVEAQSRLDAVKNSFDAACTAFGTTIGLERSSGNVRLAAAAARINEIEAALRQTSRNLDRATGDVAAAQARARERDQAVEREVAKTTAAAARAQSAEAQAGELRAQLGEVKARAAEIAGHTQSAEAKAAQLKTQLDAVNARLVELESSRARAEELERQSRTFQSQTAAINAKLADATAELARLQGDLLTSERTRLQTAVEFERAQARIAEQERALSRSETELSALKASVSTQQSRLDQLLAAQAAIQAESARNATEVTSVLAQARGLAAALEDKHDEVRALEGEVASLRTVQADYDVQVRKAERQVADLKSALAQGASQLADRNARLQRAEMEAAQERNARASDSAGREASEGSARIAAARAAKAEDDLVAAKAKIQELESRLGTWSGLMGSAMKRATSVMPGRAAATRGAPSIEEQARAIAKVGAFDAAWYLAHNPDVKEARVDPLRHYLEFGWKEGRDPNPHFSTRKYLDANPSVRGTGMSPLYHFAIVGRLERRSPQGGTVDASGDEAANLIRDEFDAGHYQSKYSAALRGQDPLVHFLQFGWRKGFDPHPAFSVSDYLSIYPDIRTAGVNPFVHYLMAGRREGRIPRKERHHTEEFLENRKVIAAEFDVAFYFSRNPDVKSAGVDPIDHFMRTGWLEGRDPTPGFSTRYYLSAQQDVREAGVNPFYHFLVAGRAEGRSPLRTEQEQQRGGIRDVVAAAFDSDFYLAINGDVAAAGVDPIDHYLDNGWSERRDPTPLFSTSFYLDSNGDVAAAGVNPFYHYLVAGKREGRKPMHPGGWRANALARLRSVDRQIEDAASFAPPSTALSFSDLTSKLESAIAQSEGRLVVSLSHDDYTTSVGGIQLCMKLEEEFARDNDAIYLNLHPAAPIPFLSRERNSRALALTVVCNGEIWGAASAAAIANALRAARSKLGAADLVIHSLLGHAPEVVVELHRALTPRRALFWLHDFFSVCPSYTLMRNGITFCGAPQPGSSACSLCVYGEERKAHLRRVTDLFANVPFDVVAPSAFAAEFWRAHSDLPHRRLIVQPHCEIEPTGLFRPAAGPLDVTRIAFLGHPSPHKGWETFVRLVDAAAADDRYEFHHFGAGRKALRGTRYTRVSVLTDGPDAMVKALRAADIDAVVLWSVWPETFSFVAHEAMSAGALILTCEESGNIARLARGPDRGLVFRDDDDLQHALGAGLVHDLVNRRRSAMREYGRPRFGDMSFALLEAERERVP